MPSEVLQHASHVMGRFDHSQPKKVRRYWRQGSGMMGFCNMLRMFFRRSAGGNAIDLAYSSFKAKQKRQFVVSLAHLFSGEFFNSPINDKIIDNIVDVRNHNVLISSYSI